MAEQTGKFSSQISANWLAQIIRPFLRHPSETWLDGAAAECAKTILFYLDNEPEPDWADLREMARNAGWTRRTLARDWFVWDDKESFVHIRRHPLGFLKISLGGDFGDVALNDPTPARVLTIARELGIGGTS